MVLCVCMLLDVFFFLFFSFFFFVYYYWFEYCGTICTTHVFAHCSYIWLFMDFLELLLEHECMRYKWFRASSLRLCLLTLLREWILLRSVCFIRKPSVEIVFHIFQYLVAQKKKKKKKPNQWKTIFGQQKTLIKIRLIFYRLVSKKLFWKTISLSRIAYPINIIFVYSRGKHNFLVPSLSHGKLSHSFSLRLTFSLLTPSLSKF